MSTSRFLRNSSFREYIRLIRRLHELIRNDTDESNEGIELRDRMDLPAEFLTQDEIETANAISADFYSLADSSIQTIQPLPSDVQVELRNALDARNHGDYPTALNLLRKNASYVHPTQLAYLRGSIWRDAGEHEIAADFFRRASELAPDNSNYSYLWLKALSRCNAPLAVDEAVKVLADYGKRPARLVLKAAEIRFESARTLNNVEMTGLLRTLVPVFQNLIVRLQLSEEDSSLVASAFTLLGLCYEHLGDSREAVISFNNGLELAPRDEALHTARGIQKYGADMNAALEDFEWAIRAGSPLVWPYYFMAHHHLCQSHFDDCLNMASRALTLHSSEHVRAQLLEWVAISQAMLGFPTGVVRATFEQAIQLSADNKRMAHNRQRFEDSVAFGAAPVDWENVSPDAVRLIARLEFRLAA